jgi:hypothetical protein
MLETNDQPVRELRNTIQMKLNQLQERVSDEAREITEFSVKEPIRRQTTEALAQNLKPQLEEARDEAERARRGLAGIQAAPPPVN